MIKKELSAIRFERIQILLALRWLADTADEISNHARLEVFFERGDIASVSIRDKNSKLSLSFLSISAFDEELAAAKASKAAKADGVGNPFFR